MAVSLDLETFHYPGGPNLFEPLNISLEEGRSVGLVGGSGSGKSSLLTSLAGLHPQPLGGRIRGQLVIGDSDPACAVGYLGSEPTLFLTGFCATVLEEVGWSLFGQGFAAEQVRCRVEQTLAELDLQDLMWQDPQTLSGGQQQMVALAAVWARQPRYLLLDEPVSRLDPLARGRLEQAVVRLAKERSVGVVWATSKLAEVAWCDTIWWLHEKHLMVVPAPNWIPSEQAEVVPAWPVLWARRWGQAEPPWNARRTSHHGPLPQIDPASPDVPFAVEIQGLRYHQPQKGGELLFQDLDWKVRQGECIGLMGVNGAGKTTLAKLLRGLLRPIRGYLQVAGKTLSEHQTWSLADSVGYVAQEPTHLFVRSRVDAELLLSGQLLGLSQDQAEHRTELALKTFSLEKYRDLHPRELPAAAASLLGIALSWYTQAKVQILDEPLARLDQPSRLLLESVIAAWRKTGITVIVIAHDLDWLCTVCSNLAFLDQGQILMNGSATDVFGDQRVAKRLGVPLALAKPFDVKNTNAKA